ncbi:MAG: SRPBCC family protein [Bacteroidota bacterium]
MSLQKYVSNIKTINWSNAVVYDRLSNLETLNFLFNPENLERAKQQLGEKADKFNIEDFQADRDSCSFKIDPVGRVGMHIVNREEGKTIKVESEEGLPMSFTLWIQLLPVNEYSCKARLTIHTELNMMMKMMIGKKLKKGVDQIADGLTQIPFGTIPSAN